MQYFLNTRTNWNEPPRSRHQLALELSKTDEVFFISRSVFGKSKIETIKIENNLTIITPVYPISTRFRYRFPIINELYQVWLYKKLLKYFNKEHFDDVRLINFDASGYYFNKFFKNSVYYCNDEVLDINRAYILPFLPYIDLCERLLAKNSAFCVSVSYYLKDKMLRLNANSIYLPTASIKIPDNTYNETKDRENINNLTIGFVGFLGFKVSKDIIKFIAKTNPNWKIILVTTNLAKSNSFFEKYSNIVCYDSKVNDDLYDLFSNVDVCIAPLKKSKFTKYYATMLNKFWIYLSLGKPIVSTKIENSKIEVPYIYHADSNEEFVDNIKKAYLNDSIENFNQRKVFAANNTWKQRVESLKDAFNKFSGQ